MHNYLCTYFKHIHVTDDANSQGEQHAPPQHVP